MSCIISTRFACNSPLVGRQQTLNNEVNFFKAGVFKLNGARISLRKGDSIIQIADKINTQKHITNIQAKLVTTDLGFKLELESKNRIVNIVDYDGVLTSLYKQKMLGTDSKCLVHVLRAIGSERSNDVIIRYKTKNNIAPFNYPYSLNGFDKLNLAKINHYEDNIDPWIQQAEDYAFEQHALEESALEADAHAKNHSVYIEKVLEMMKNPIMVRACEVREKFKRDGIAVFGASDISRDGLTPYQRAVLDMMENPIMKLMEEFKKSGKIAAFSASDISIKDLTLYQQKVVEMMKNPIIGMGCELSEEDSLVEESVLEADAHAKNYSEYIEKVLEMMKNPIMVRACEIMKKFKRDGIVAYGASDISRDGLSDYQKKILDMMEHPIMKLMEEFNAHGSAALVHADISIKDLTLYQQKVVEMMKDPIMGMGNKARKEEMVLSEEFALEAAAYAAKQARNQNPHIMPKGYEERQYGGVATSSAAGIFRNELRSYQQNGVDMMGNAKMPKKGKDEKHNCTIL